MAKNVVRDIGRMTYSPVTVSRSPQTAAELARSESIKFYSILDLA